MIDTYSNKITVDLYVWEAAVCTTTSRLISVKITLPT